MPNEQLFKGIDRLWRMGTVVPCKGIRIPESWIQLKESEIPLTIEIQNPESRIPVSLSAKTGINHLEYGIHSVESRVQELS